jgi:hypothetical protein
MFAQVIGGGANLGGKAGVVCVDKGRGAVGDDGVNDG